MKTNILWLLVLAPTTIFAANVPPHWVKNGGHTPSLSKSVYLTGFGMAEGEKALPRAKNQAAADLAKKIRVRIEQEMADKTVEKDGEYGYSVASITRSSTNLTLQNLDYKTYVEAQTAYALAFVKKESARAQQGKLRDQALAGARTCIASASKAIQNGKNSMALRRFLSCKTPLTTAVEHLGICQALGDAGTAQQQELVDLNQQIADHVQQLVAKQVSTLDDAIEALAIQLSLQGIGKECRLNVGFLTYGTTPFSSVFGRQVAKMLESAIARTSIQGKKACLGEVLVQGTYFDSNKMVSMQITGRDPKQGKMLAGAQTKLPMAGIPKALPVKPQNFDEALKSQKLLAHGEAVSGDLQVEVWTNKGDRNLVFSEVEELKIFLRVNQPAYVRLVYLLTSGAKVPLEQAYFIDSTKVNRAVEYPDAFEVSPPFGIEQIYAVAFTEKPIDLPTVTQVFDGEEYDVVTTEQVLIKHRGLKKKQKKAQSAETVLSLTTMPR